MRRFMEIHATLPFGNDGRGTKVYLWPFVYAGLIVLAAWGVDVYVVR